MTETTIRGRDLGLLIAASVCCAMSLIDSTIVPLATPAIIQKLGGSDGRWIISAFFLGFASSLLPAGAIADRHGRRRVLLWGLTALAAASLASGLAPAIGWLVPVRAVQGVATAFVLAPALALIGHRFREPAIRSQAWMIWGTIMGLTMVLSPFLGGFIVDKAGWRGAFILNLPICLALILAIYKLSGESQDNARRLPAFLRISAFAAMMFCLTWVLILGPGAGWLHRDTLGAGLLALLALGVVLLAGPRGKRLPLLSNAALVGAVLAMFAYAAAAQVMASLLPMSLQVMDLRDAAQIGLTVLPFTLAMLIFPHPGARLSERIGTPRMLVLGLLVVALGKGAAAAAALAGVWPLFLPALFLIGAGAGLLNGETQKAIMVSMPPELTGMASGISTTARFSGVLMGFTALGGAVDPSRDGLAGLAPAMACAMAVALVSALCVAGLMRRA